MGAGFPLKDKGDDSDELKSLLFEVNKSPDVSHFLCFGTLANFTLAKRQDSLDKSHLSEALKDRFLFSLSICNKLFDLPL